MRVVSVTLRNFRSYERATATLGDGLTVVTGANGAGKTNLLEAIYFSCTGRSCRTATDREAVRFGSSAARLEAQVDGSDGAHALAVAFAAGEAKRMTVDGAAVDRLADSPHRPLVTVFLPDRLELVKGVPALRRAHLDQVAAALWPTRVAVRRAYNQTLAQRNALLSRIRTGAAHSSALETWDLQLAAAAVPLMSDRSTGVSLVAPAFTETAGRLGLDGAVSLTYRPRSQAPDPAAFADELRSRREADIERGFTGHGPHRDDLVIACDGRELRTYGSQGQQRLALLALLLAERSVITAARDNPPILLLDDVMSELDRERRAALVEVISESPGQALVTTTDLEHVPDLAGGEVTTIEVGMGGELRTAVPSGGFG